MRRSRASEIFALFLLGQRSFSPLSRQDESLDLSFLQHIREVTGYVLISHVDVARIVLPSLQIIRGRTLFKLNVQDDQFALMVTLSKMHNLEMPALRGKEGRKKEVRTA